MKSHYVISFFWWMRRAALISERSFPYLQWLHPVPSFPANFYGFITFLLFLPVIFFVSCYTEGPCKQGMEVTITPSTWEARTRQTLIAKQHGKMFFLFSFWL